MQKIENIYLSEISDDEKLHQSADKMTRSSK